MPITPDTNIFTNLINNVPTDIDGSTYTSRLNEIKANVSAHDTLLTSNQNVLGNVASAQNTMYTMAIDENTRLNKKQQNIDQALQGQNRMISLNDSYVKKYAKYNQIVMVVVLVLLVILGATLLPTYLPMIPSAIGDLLIVLAVGIGAIVVYTIYIGIQKRDPLYFDKLNIPAPTVKDLSANALDMSLNSVQTNLLNGICIGQECCTYPAQYINSIGKCMNPPTQIYDYTVTNSDGSQGKYKKCNGMNCPNSDTDPADVIQKKTWVFDRDNNQWINAFTQEYWDIEKKTALPIASQASQQDAPTLSESFSNIQSTSVEPMQSSETSDYSFYR